MLNMLYIFLIKESTVVTKKEDKMRHFSETIDIFKIKNTDDDKVNRKQSIDIGQK
jgi:hypothetical protein